MNTVVIKQVEPGQVYSFVEGVIVDDHETVDAAKDAAFWNYEGFAVVVIR